MGCLGRRRHAGARLAGWLLGLALAGCASLPDQGVTHVVRPGENLYRISRYYGVELDQVIRANHIRDVTALEVGRQLFIPGAHRRQPANVLTPAPGGHVPLQQGDRSLALREADLRFAWPISGRVSSRFGWRGGQRHEGVDIPAPRGTPVHAAEAGRVIYSGKLSDYGNVVILKHAGRYSTVYAHNRENRVRKGQFVEKGDVIARVGKTGNASGPHLHFEVRRDRIAHDPLAYLPEVTHTARNP